LKRSDPNGGGRRQPHLDPCSRDQLGGLNRGLGVDSCELDGEDERDAIEDKILRFGVVGELVSCAVIALGERPAASALR
jgi:hypothetical protein